jgi:hypothetical protein
MGKRGRPKKKENAATEVVHFRVTIREKNRLRGLAKTFSNGNMKRFIIEHTINAEVYKHS